MNATGTILLKRISAAIFLVLFLLIHIVKLTHHHSAAPPLSTGWTKAHLNSTGDCSICMYQLAKDADHHHGFVLATASAAHSSVYPSYNTPFVTSVGAASSGRGPPAHC